MHTWGNGLAWFMARGAQVAPIYTSISEFTPVYKAMVNLRGASTVLVNFRAYIAVPGNDSVAICLNARLESVC
jgi:hypothetical protein